MKILLTIDRKLQELDILDFMIYRPSAPESDSIVIELFTKLESVEETSNKPSSKGIIIGSSAIPPVTISSVQHLYEILDGYRVRYNIEFGSVPKEGSHLVELTTKHFSGFKDKSLENHIDELVKLEQIDCKDYICEIFLSPELTETEDGKGFYIIETLRCKKKEKENDTNTSGIVS